MVTLTAATVDANNCGYMNIPEWGVIAGNISEDILPGYTTKILTNGASGSIYRWTVVVSGDATTALASVTGININGIIYSVAEAPIYDPSYFLGPATSIGFESASSIIAPGTYEVSLVGGSSFAIATPSLTTIFRGYPLDLPLTASAEVASWEITGGANSSSFVVVGDELHWSGNPPTTSGTYVVDIKATSTEEEEATKTITVKVSAIMVVGQWTFKREGSTSSTTVFFGTPLQQDDIVVLGHAIGSTASRSMTISGYTQLGSSLYANGTSYDANLAVFYKRMGATPDTYFTLGSSGNASSAQVVTITVLRGVHTTTAVDVTQTTATAPGSGGANPPSITPVTQDALGLFFAAVATSSSNIASINYQPADTPLDNPSWVAQADTQSITLGTGSLPYTGSALDPGIFLGNSAGAGNSWAAMSTAWRPAPAPEPEPIVTSAILNKTEDNDTVVSTGKFLAKITTPATLYSARGKNMEASLVADQSITTWAISGGTHAAKFTIDSNKLKWVTPETTNGAYTVIVSATNASGTSYKTFTVIVKSILLVGYTFYTLAGSTSSNTAQINALTPVETAELVFDSFTETFSAYPVEGDLVVVTQGYGTNNSSFRTSVTTSGYTSVSNVMGGASYNSSTSVYYKTMGSSVDTSVTLGPGYSTGDSHIIFIAVYRGVSGAPMDVTATTATNSGSNIPIDFSSITPITQEALVVFAGTKATSNSASSMNNPTGFDSYYKGWRSNTRSAGFVIGFKKWGGSGAVSASSVNSNAGVSGEGISSVTIALRPAPLAGSEISASFSKTEDSDTVLSTATLAVVETIAVVAITEEGDAPSTESEEPAEPTTGTAWNPLDKSSSVIITGLQAANNGTASVGGVRADQSKTTGKWYFEATINQINNTYGILSIGVSNWYANLGQYIGVNSDGVSYMGSGYAYYNGNYIWNNTGAMAVNDVIGVAFDADAKKIWFSRNGVFGGSPAAGTGAIEVPTLSVYYPTFGSYQDDAATANFGLTAFAYSPPSGFSAFDTVESGGGEETGSVGFSAVLKLRATATKAESPDTVASSSKIKIGAASTHTQADDTLTSFSFKRALAQSSISEAQDTTSSVSKVRIKAISSHTQANDGIASTSISKIRAIFNKTEGNDTFTSTSKNKTHGKTAIAESSDTLSNTSVIKLRAIVPENFEENDLFASTVITIVGVDTEIVEQDDTISTSGYLGIKAITNIVEGNDSPSLVATSGLKASLDIEEFDDITTSASKITLSATSITEISDSFITTAHLFIQALHNITEQDDAILSHSTALSGAVVYIDEDDDQIVSNMIVYIAANGNLIDDPDLTISSAKNIISASLADEDSDTSSITARIALKASVSSVEAPDVLNAPAIIQDVYRASVGFTEASDGILAIARLRNEADISLIEASDIIDASGDAIISAIITSNEMADAFTAQSSLVIAGEFTGFEIDDITASAIIDIKALVDITEAYDQSQSLIRIDLEGEAAILEDDDSLFMASSFTVFSWMDILEDGDDLVSSTKNPLVSSSLTTEENDAFIIASKLNIKSGFYCLEDNDDQIVTVHNPLKALMNITEIDDGLYAFYDFGTAYADAINQEQDDQVAITGKLPVTAHQSKTEASDIVSAIIEKRLVGQAVITEADDAVYFVIDLPVTSEMTVLEDDDQVISKSGLRIISYLGVIEDDDDFGIVTYHPVKASSVLFDNDDGLMTTSKIRLGAASHTVDHDGLNSDAEIVLSAFGENHEDDDGIAIEVILPISAWFYSITDADVMESWCYVLGNEPERDDTIKAYAVIKAVEEIKPKSDDDSDGSIHLVWANETYGPARINTRRLKKSLNTVAIHAHAFEGTVIIEGTIAQNPKEEDWFVIAVEQFVAPTSTETNYENRMVEAKGRIVMMRASVDGISGDVDRVLVL